MAQPNIIYVLADDMGYGDMAGNDPACRIPTPHLDRLAAQGMRFTDAHAASAVCTPSRYSILTGRYCWRSRLKQGIVWEWDGALIEPGRPTVASFLKSLDYDTACLGKWHLGWDWPTIDGRHPNETLPFGRVDTEARAARNVFDKKIDFTQRIRGGPVDHGFDSYFGVDVPNFPPYAWFEDDHLTELPSVTKPEAMYGRPGCAAPNWVLEAMIPEFTQRAVEYVESHAPEEGRTSAPYFLYVALTSPHSPIVPNAPFRGRSGIGAYGDFVCEVDWVVGQIMESLDRTGQAENTLLVFTSDNGPERRTPDDEGVYDRARRTAHYSMGPLRGMKRDAWDGGHRVPFVAAWPGVIPAGSTCDQTVGLLDLMATCSDITAVTLPEGAGEDSVSMWPLLQGLTDQATRACLVHHSASGKFAIREGDWVYIEAPSGGDNPEPDWFIVQRGYAPHDQPGELFNLADDLAERTNRHAERPELVAHLAGRLRQIKNGHAPTRSAAIDEPMTE